MKKFFSEFKTFIMRGNVLDLAVGVIIGAAFQAIVTSLTTDIISPILGLFGGMNFDQYALTIGDVSIDYGKFLTAVINFIIMAFVISLLLNWLIRLLQSVKSLKNLKNRQNPQQKFARSVRAKFLLRLQNAHIAQAIFLKKQRNKSLIHKLKLPILLSGAFLIKDSILNVG